jgi:hypothetical protein
MAIPDAQLETWSHQGAITSSRDTHMSIRAALTAQQSTIRQLISNGYVEIYLQGSYKNDTNIRGDSDVDVVVELNTTFSHNAHALPAEQQEAFQATYPITAYPWANFRTDVLKTLRAYYGAAIVTEGNRALKLPRQPGRVGADVVVVIEHKEFDYFVNRDLHQDAKGIAFFTQREGRRVINFPKLHYDNGCNKNSADRTGGNYKATVRIFKNARGCLIDRGVIPDDLAPSYFIECLVHSVPDARFRGKRSDIMFESLSWLWHEADLNTLMCQNGRLRLIGDSPEQWAQAKAVAFIQAMVNLWDNWT